MTTCLTRFKSSNPLKILISDTKFWWNTKVLVAGVSGRTNTYIDVMNAVFNAIDSIRE